MGDLDDLLGDLLDDVVGPGWRGDGEPADLPRRVRETGLDLVGYDEAGGGSGGTLADAATVVTRVAQAGADLPLTERLLQGAHLCRVTGLAPDPRTLAVVTAGSDPVADVHGVAGLRNATTVLLVRQDDGDGVVTALGSDGFTVVPGVDVAGAARDTLRLTAAGRATLGHGPAERRVPATDLRDAVALLGALGRSCQIVGALRATLNLVVDHAAQRHQFGRPLRSHQLVQLHLAEIATQLAATEAAVASVFELDEHVAAPTALGAATRIAAAKVAASTAADSAARHAHQVTGALGMAAEFPLHHLTRRLWTWSQEYGPVRHWARRLARTLRDHPGDLWSLVGPTLPSAPPTKEHPTWI